jgi:NitT/TauT family transport system substrate-binding protein
MHRPGRADGTWRSRLAGSIGLAALLSGLLGAACAPAAPPAPAADRPSAARSASAASSAAAPAASPIKLNVAFSSRSGNTTGLFVAMERGYFPENGVDADLIFASSITSGQAMAANSIPIGLVGSEGFDLNLEHGSPITRYIAGVTTKFVYKIIGRPEIGSMQDLRGKVVGATRQGAVSDYAVRKALLRYGLNADTDVSMTYPGGTDASLASLLAGYVDAIPAAPPTDRKALQQGMKLLVDLEPLNMPFWMAGILARSDFAQENPDLIERFLKGYLRGVATALTDAEAAMDALAKYLELDDRELLRATYDTYRPTWSRDQLVPEEAVIATLQESPKPAARTANPKDFYDNSYLERIKASGYVDRLYASPRP